jgi:hypothetical protein
VAGWVAESMLHLFADFASIKRIVLKLGADLLDKLGTLYRVHTI